MTDVAPNPNGLWSIWTFQKTLPGLNDIPIVSDTQFFHGRTKAFTHQKLGLLELQEETHLYRVPISFSPISASAHAIVHQFE